MHQSEFIDGVSTGRLVPIPGNLTAFVPSELPPKWTMPNEFWPLIRDAWATIKELNGIGRVLPDPMILLKPLEDREAIQSSRIEGTYATARELLLFERVQAQSAAYDEKRNAWREVWNYRQALKHGVEINLPLSKRLIRELHQKLLSGVRGEEKSPGEFRKVHVGIRQTGDGVPKFVPPPPELVDTCLNSLESYLHTTSTQFDPLVDCFLVHYQFETIHPFRDGNGRVGRLLLALMIQQRCQLAHPWLLISQYLESHKDEYFDLLFKVSRDGDWSSWVKFCLEATIAQASDTLARCQRLLSTRDQLKEKLISVKSRHKLMPIVDLALEKIMVSVGDVKDRFGVTYPTALSHLERLVEQSILKQIPDFSPKMFYSPELFGVTYGDLEDKMS